MCSYFSSPFVCLLKKMKKPFILKIKGAQKTILCSVLFLSSGLYRRCRILTSSAEARGLIALSRITTGEELHLAPKQTIYYFLYCMANLAFCQPWVYNLSIFFRFPSLTYIHPRLAVGIGKQFFACQLNGRIVAACSRKHRSKPL